MGNRLALCAVALALASCGGHDAQPPEQHTVRPEPGPVTTATPTPTPTPVPTPTPTPTPTAPEPTAPAPPEPVATNDTPPAPPTPLDEDPTLAPMPAYEASIDETYEVGREPIADGWSMDAELVTLESEPGTTALAARVQTDAKRILGADDNAPAREYEGACVVTLATQQLVSYSCHYDVTIPGDREDLVINGHGGLTYALHGAQVQGTTVESWFVPGTDKDVLADIACRKAARAHHTTNVHPGDWLCHATGFAFSVQENGVRVAWSSEDYAYGGGDPEEDTQAGAILGWQELGKLVRRDGPLAALPQALEHADDETPLYRAAGPPPPGTMVTAFGEEDTLTNLAVRYAAETGVRVMVTDVAAGRGRLVRARSVLRASIDGRAGVTTAEVPWTLPQLVLSSRRVRRALSLHAGQRNTTPVVGPLGVGTRVATLTGPIGALDSDLGPGMWTYVVANGSTAGWLPSGTIDGHLGWVDEHATSLLAARFPAEQRAAATSRTTVMGLSNRDDHVSVAFAPSADGAHTELLVELDPGEAKAFATLDGRIADVRLTRTAARSGEMLLLVSLVRPTAPAGAVLWQAYRLTAAEHAAPVLDLALPTGATLRAGVQHGGRFAPVLVHVRGSGDTTYTWNGTVLAVPGR